MSVQQTIAFIHSQPRRTLKNESEERESYALLPSVLLKYLHTWNQIITSRKITVITIIRISTLCWLFSVAYKHVGQMWVESLVNLKSAYFDIHLWIFEHNILYYLKNYLHHSCFVVFCYGLVLVKFAHILRGYFTDTMEIIGTIVQL